MNSLRERAAGWLAGGRKTAVVTIAAASGSTPRGTGTRMLVSAEQVAGTIGGGHLELAAIRLAREWLGTNAVRGIDPPAAFERRYALGPSLGQCCGGSLTLNFAMLSAQTIARWPDEPRLFHLALFGAGHVGRALIRVLETLPCSVDWIDERDGEFDALQLERNGQPLAGHINCIAVDEVVAEVARQPADAVHLVLTHSHDLDQAICEAILARGEFGFLGLIGSKTKNARFKRRFRERGFSGALIARVQCPIGVAGIEGKQPEIIAVAVAAQLLQIAGKNADELQRHESDRIAAAGRD